MPHKTDSWFVSPWNELPEVTKELAFANGIELHDITLRDGEQQAGIEFTRAEKVEIAKLLAAAGVHRIEAGMPAVSPDDEAAIREIVELDLPARIFAFARCMVSDVELAADCGVDGIVVEIPSSQHLIQEAYGWPVEKAIELSVEATLAAKEAGLYTVFFPIDSSRAEMEWYLDLIERVASEGHMDALAVVDTFGGTSPHAIPYWIGKLRERLGDRPLECHFHDDFGLAVANTVMGLAAGANVAHTTVTGIGERAGNCALEDLVLALLLLYGTDLGIDTTTFTELSRTVRNYADHSIPANRAIVGERLFDVESGIIAGFVQRCGETAPTNIFPYHWDLVGQKPGQVVLGKNSGLPSIALWLERLGLDADGAARERLLALVKERSLAGKRLLTEDEFVELHALAAAPVGAAAATSVDS
jgi:isopropylmalate/homocitrate/citramalate synthase